MNSARGRPRISSRVFEHQCPAIDTADFKKIPGFRPDISYAFLPDVMDPVLKLSVSYRWNDGKEAALKLQATRPNFGGARYWYVCPHCDRRVRKLYIDDRSHSMACRRCFRLIYDSQYRKGPRHALFGMIRKWVTEYQRDSRRN